MDKRVFSGLVEAILFNSDTKYFQLSTIVDELFDAAIVALEQPSEEEQIRYFKDNSLDYKSLHWDQFSEEIFQRMELLWSGILDLKAGKRNTDSKAPERILLPPKGQQQISMSVETEPSRSNMEVPVAPSDEQKITTQPNIIIHSGKGKTSPKNKDQPIITVGKKKCTVFKLKTGLF